MRKDRFFNGPEAANLDMLVGRMEEFGELSTSEQDLIRSCRGARDHSPNAVILDEGDGLIPLWFMSGWACRLKILADGRRQIINFILPGDSIGLRARPMGRSSCRVTCLTAVRTLDGTAVARALEGRAHRGLNEALQGQSAADEEILCEQIVRLGRRSAFERVSDLLIELNARLRKVGLADGNRFKLPLTQEILADAVGLSIVHVNRTLQQMRREGVVELRSGYVRVLEPAAMLATANALLVGL